MSDQLPVLDISNCELPISKSALFLSLQVNPRPRAITCMHMHVTQLCRSLSICAYFCALVIVCTELLIDRSSSSFERMKESNDSIYGKLRKQKKVNSDDFFKDFLMNQNNENPDFQESKDENNVQQNPFFDTLNLIYKNVKSLD